MELLNTRAHSIFRPSFYRFSQHHWLANHEPALLRRLPLQRRHHVALRPYRALGCFDEQQEHDYLGWMDTARGRHTFADFFADYRVPAVPGLANGLGRIGCPTAVIWGDPDRYIPFSTARELAECIPGCDSHTANRRRSLHHGGASGRGDGCAYGTAREALGTACGGAVFDRMSNGFVVTPPDQVPGAHDALALHVDLAALLE
jgi:pimeloyl-ACP methyl ester carboxylesterase